MKLKQTLMSLLALGACVSVTGTKNFRGLQEQAQEQAQDQPLSVEEASPPSFKLMNVGQIVQALVLASEFTNSTFDTITINGFDKVVSENGSIYSAQLTVENDQGVALNAQVTGNYDPVEKSLVLNAAMYNVEVSGNSTEGEQGGDDGSETVPPIVEPPVENPDNTGNPVPDNTITWPEGYTGLTQDQVNNDAVASAALAYGLNTLVQKGINQYKIPAASPDYQITNFIGAAVAQTSYGFKYLFYTNLTNSLNYKVDANVTVTYKTANQNYTLVGYSFRSRGYPINAIQPPAPVNNNTNVVPPTDSTPVVPPTDNSNPTTPTDNSTVIVEPTPTQPAAPVVNPDGFTVYTPEGYAQDANAKAALQWGVSTLVQKMLDQNKIPAKNANYNINNVALAAFKKTNNGVNYQFQVTLNNIDNVQVAANMTVVFKTVGNSYSFNTYSYKVWNIKNGNNNNNNNSSKPASATPANNGNSNSNASTPAASTGANTVVIDPSVAAGTTNNAAATTGDANPTVVLDSSALGN